jgi:hypothetical protein
MAMKMDLKEFFQPNLREAAVDPKAPAFKPAPMADPLALPGEADPTVAPEVAPTQDTASLDQEDIKFFEAAAGRISKVKATQLEGFDAGQLSAFATAIDLWLYQLYLQIADPNVRNDFVEKANGEAAAWEKSMNSLIDAIGELPKA